MEAITNLNRPERYNNKDNIYLKKWEIICGGITKNIKVNIVKKKIQNKKIDKIISQKNNEINNVISTIEKLENPKFKYSLRANNIINEQNREFMRIDNIKNHIKNLEDLLNEKHILIKKKEEIL